MTLASKLEVCGFLSITEIGSPASLSRHLVVLKVEREKPTRRSSEKSSSQKVTAANSTSSSAGKILDLSQPNYEYEKLEQDIRDFYSKDKDNDDSNDDVIEVTPRPTESVCVLLHGALKVENCAAVVLLNDNWFGFRIRRRNLISSSIYCRTAAIAYPGWVTFSCWVFRRTYCPVKMALSL